MGHADCQNLRGVPASVTLCAGQMRIIAFIAEGQEVDKILEYIGVDAHLPRITPARGPPLCDACDAQEPEGVEVEPEWSPSAHQLVNV